MKLLSRIEEIVLLSIWRLQDDAYGMTIRQEVINATGKNWLLGAIYGPLGRIQKNGFVETVKGDPKPERGGRAKIFYRLTPKGKEALIEIQKINQIIWNDLPSLDWQSES